MPSRISFAQEIAYLRTLVDTGNASLAAAQAGVVARLGLQAAAGRCAV